MPHRATSIARSTTRSAHTADLDRAAVDTLAARIDRVGDDGYAHVRGFGRTVSPATFGHNGAGGQIAWADPATGLSFAFVTNGYDRHEVRQPKRTTALGSLAAVTAPPR